jgi:xanthine dehydrogenase accessory factor
MQDVPSTGLASPPQPTGYLAAAGLLAVHGRIVVATVIATWGSSPVPVGGAMLIIPGGHFIGSVSGGCIEAEVLAAAEDILADGRPRILEFGVADQIAWGAGLPCGGFIRVFAERLDHVTDAGWIADVAAAVTARQPLVVTIALSTGMRLIADAGSATADAAQALAAGASRVTGVGQNEMFHLVLAPRLHTLLIGATDIARHLAPLLTGLGHDVTVVDPRAAFASDARFPGAALAVSWPGEALQALRLDRFCAVVATTHRDDLDDEALAAALASDCVYIGALGSRRNHARRLERLAAHGFDAISLARIRGPVGLDIGAVTPAEIALSIAAEIVATVRGAARDRS